MFSVHSKKEPPYFICVVKMIHIKNQFITRMWKKPEIEEKTTTKLKHLRRAIFTLWKLVCVCLTQRPAMTDERVFNQPNCLNSWWKLFSSMATFSRLKFYSSEFVQWNDWISVFFLLFPSLVIFAHIALGKSENSWTAKYR